MYNDKRIDDIVMSYMPDIKTAINYLYPGPQNADGIITSIHVLVDDFRILYNQYAETLQLNNISAERELMYCTKIVEQMKKILELEHRLYVLESH
jgi:hypothetical protein